MRSVFISYRRGDSVGTAGRIRDRLVSAFGRRHVFVDVDDIPPGSDFRQVISERLNASRVLLAIIGPGWVDARKVDGSRRLDNLEDFVVFEISSGLAAPHITVIPVLIDGARMPGVDELPPSLADLPRLNAFELRSAQFTSDIERLIAALRQQVGSTRAPTWAFLALAAAAVITLAGAVVLFDPFQDRTRAPWRDATAAGLPTPPAPVAPSTLPTATGPITSGREPAQPPAATRPSSEPRPTVETPPTVVLPAARADSPLPVPVPPSPVPSPVPPRPPPTERVASASVKSPADCALAARQVSDGIGGVATIELSSTCGPVGDVVVRYLSYAFRKRVAGGRLDVDMFGGAAEIVFDAGDRGMTRLLPQVAVDNVVKIALVWKAAVKLGLFARQFGEPDLVSRSNPRGLLQARQGTTGFMSSTGDGLLDGDHVEVYTFIKVPNHRIGGVQFHVEYSSRVEAPRGDVCSNGSQARVDFRILSFQAGVLTDLEPRKRFLSLDCGAPLEDRDRSQPLTARVQFGR